MEFKTFNAKTVALKESNLIEASAGTGKTYSIAILVLRLILENEIPVKEILMVTFTKAAVAELEERIRLFVRAAQKYSMQEGEADETISAVVNAAILKKGNKEIQRLLKTAVLFLDEVSVLTIHSFCQQTLTEFAFETNQLFGAKTMQDAEAVLIEEVDRFWRQYITTIPAELLQFLVNAGLTRESIKNVVKEHLNGKSYLHYEKEKNYNYCEEDYSKLSQQLRELGLRLEQLNVVVNDYLVNNKEALTQKLRQNGKAKQFKYNLLDNPVHLHKHIVENRTKGYIAAVFEEALQHCDDCLAVEQEVEDVTKIVINNINCQAINAVEKGIEDYKQRNNMLSFDDMIVNLHKALHGGAKQKLVGSLHEKYKAVFIDEFQDTDKLQYEIFDAAFNEHAVLFYIGDPKQSIYGWRKADIFTYFKAQEHVKNRYQMNENYRSSRRLIEAMNKFFLPQESFDTFAFGNARQAIRYIPVNAPALSKKGELLVDRQPDVPIAIFQHPNKEEIVDGVVANIIHLLNNDSFQLPAREGTRKVTPADIGILVRSKLEGESIKDALASFGIPAVQINDNKVLCSDEALYMLYLLTAIAQPTPDAINKALLSPFTGYTTKEILLLNAEQTIELFRKYKDTWDRSGIYAALSQFAVDFNVRQILLQGNSKYGERIITNFFQLMEVVHKVQNQKQFTAPELISWLKRGIEGMEIEGDEYEQRVESDEEAIKIVTIHSSKGLEYKIVFAPFLDFITDNKRDIASFRHPDGQYLSGNKKEFTVEQTGWLADQLEQENRRLLYVAITRAVYKCYISKNTYRNFSQSTVSEFISACMQNPSPLIAICTPPSIPDGYRYTYNEQRTTARQRHEVDFSLLQQNWIRMSYTKLAADHETIVKPKTGASAEPYDQFIFNQLVRGATTGNLLHYIFENISFSDRRRHEYYIKEAIKRYAPRQQELYMQHLQMLLQHVLHANITVGGVSFQLNEIEDQRRLQELEFDFTVPAFKASDLEQLSDETMKIIVNKGEAEGIMNGKIDLFFAHNGKYYILDWKSNYLGDRLEHYSKEALADAMNESNYHLQYLLYTVAVKKYIKSREPNFNYNEHFGGVIYLFVRGVRMNGESGIFTNRPTANQLKTLEHILEGKRKNKVQRA